MFVVVGLVTFGDLAQVQYEPSAGDLGTELNGALAATFIAPVSSWWASPATPALRRQPCRASCQSCNSKL